MQAQSINSISDQLSGGLSQMADLITATCFLIGIGVGAASAFKFKAYADNPEKAPLSAALTMMMVSACLIGLPAFLNVVDNTAVPTEYAASEETPVTEPAPPEPEQSIDAPEGGSREGQWVTDRAIR